MCIRDRGEADGYVEEHKTEELFQPTIDIGQDENAADQNQSKQENPKSVGIKIASESQRNDSFPMHFTRNASITKDLVIKYGPSKGCAGCKYALGQQSWIQGHTQYCRKRFLELSEVPGNEALKEKIDKSLEKAARRYLELSLIHI